MKEMTDKEKLREALAEIVYDVCYNYASKQDMDFSKTVDQILALFPQTMGEKPKPTQPKIEELDLTEVDVNWAKIKFITNKLNQCVRAINNLTEGKE
jgi:hypothetical protein